MTQLPAPWAALVRRRLQSLLQSEARALAHLRLLARDTLGSPRDATEIRRAAHRLEWELEQAILDIRADARSLAEQMFLEELELAGIEAPDLSYADDDEARAVAVSHSFVAALLFALLLLLKRGQDPKRALALEDYRLRRIAATEVAQAYGAAFTALAGKLSVPAFGLRWDATLDKKLCQVCLSHHGEIVTLGHAFRDDAVPGDVHPQCRCIPTLIPLSP